MATAYEDVLKLADEVISWFEKYGDPEQFMDQVPEEFRNGFRETYKLWIMKKKRQG